MNHEEAKAANRKLYDALGAEYEATDGRRGPALRAWLSGRLSALRARVPGGALLDVGTGSGFLVRCAEGSFGPRVGVDISPRVLPEFASDGAFFVAADCDSLPFRDASFDAVCCFAVLHHFHSHEKLFSEVSRVLKPGGAFYCDHDMDSAFASRFSLPLALYRKLRGAEHGYERLGIDKKLYESAEVHAAGLDSQALLSLMKRNGLVPEPLYHWYGLSPLTDRLFGTRAYPRGFAPLFSCIAVKR
ncbi:MAG: class I SAM-dependent methyltransferase [Elusimicrobia bacterium]|nr:class I SAM-dependent methyltransferase [Elusimicrobiota bacterium]